MTTEDTEYVGFWPRVGAAIIDTALIWVIIGPLLTLHYGTSYWHSDGRFIAGGVDVLLSWIFPAVATLLFWFAKQATPGKMAISTVIVDARTGGPASAKQFFIRYLGYLLASIPLGLGILWVAFDKRKQGWHDKLAGTVVVRQKNRQAQPVTFGD
ncbi:MAG: RDD family protein [Brachymonas sp.]|jgi:uncharacterized RDD family membrane protein YckC